MQIDGFKTIVGMDVEMDALLASDDDDLLFRAVDFRSLASGGVPRSVRTCEPLALDTLASHLETNSTEPNLFSHRCDTRANLMQCAAPVLTDLSQVCESMLKGAEVGLVACA